MTESYYQRNREKMLAKAKEYQSENREYYREKYRERLKFLLNEKGISSWWWRIYRWSSI